MKRTYKWWTLEELNRLKELSLTRSAGRISIILGRSEKSIEEAKRRYNIKKKSCLQKELADSL